MDLLGDSVIAPEQLEDIIVDEIPVLKAERVLALHDKPPEEQIDHLRNTMTSMQNASSDFLNKVEGALLQSTKDMAETVDVAWTGVETYLIEQLFKAPPYPYARRPNVYARRYPGFTLGLTAHASEGATARLSVATRLYPGLARALATCARRTNPDFHFSTIQVNFNCKMQPHVDSKNVGQNLIVGLGDYESRNGEDLFVQEKGGKQYITMTEDKKIGLTKYKKGKRIMGRKLSIKYEPQVFDGHQVHASLEWKEGTTRITVVYYIFQKHMNASKKDKDDLRKYGFNLPDS
jgi:hypothetical protein